MQNIITAIATVITFAVFSVGLYPHLDEIEMFNAAGNNSEVWHLVFKYGIKPVVILWLLIILIAGVVQIYHSVKEKTTIKGN